MDKFEIYELFRLSCVEVMLSSMCLTVQLCQQDNGENPHSKQRAQLSSFSYPLLYFNMLVSVLFHF